MNPDPTIQDLLDAITVFHPGDWENEDGPKEWHAVADEKGIIAYFGHEADAFAFRQMLINLRLNGAEVLARYQR